MTASPQIIISYRKDDTQSIAGRLYDHLCNRFGEDHIVFGVESLVKVGDDYVDAIHSAVASAKIFLVLLGNKWTASAWHSDNNDLDKIAIRDAIANKINLIPVLVDGVNLTAMEDFPREFESLRRRTPITIRETHFRADIVNLLVSLDTIFEAGQRTNTNSDVVSNGVLNESKSMPSNDSRSRIAYTSSDVSQNKSAVISSRWLVPLCTITTIICFFLPWTSGASPFSVFRSGLFFLLALVPIASVISFVATYVRGVHSSTVCAVCGISSLSTLLFFALALWQVSESLPILAFLAIGSGVLAIAGFLATRTSQNSRLRRIYVGTVVTISFIFFALFMIDARMTVFTWLTVVACELILVSAFLIDEERMSRT